MNNRYISNNDKDKQKPNSGPEEVPSCLSPRRMIPFHFLYRTDWSYSGWAPCKALIHQASPQTPNLFCLQVMVVTGKPQCAHVRSYWWVERFGCQTSVRPHFSSLPHRVPLAAASIWLWLICQGWLYNVQWKWRNGLPITASHSHCLANKSLSADLTALGALDLA